MKDQVQPVNAYLVFECEQTLYPALLAQLATDALAAQSSAPLSAPLLLRRGANLVTAEASITVTGCDLAQDRLPRRPDGGLAEAKMAIRVTVAPQANKAAEDNAAVMARLAGLVHSLASYLSPDFIAWTGAKVFVPTPDFLKAVAPVRPRRPLRSAQTYQNTARGWRKTAANVDVPLTDPKTGAPETVNAHLYRTEQELRCAMTSEIAETERAHAKATRGEPVEPPVEARLTGWALSLPVAASLAVYNVARGEDVRVASLAMGVMGLFASLNSMGVEFNIFAGLI